MAAGTTQLTATSGSVSSTADTLTVTNPAVASITLAPASPTIAVGGTEQFTATAKATAAAAGTTQITASAGGATSAADTLTVTAAVATITLAPLAPAVQVGQTQQFTATAKDAGGNTLSGLSFTWAAAPPA